MPEVPVKRRGCFRPGEGQWFRMSRRSAAMMAAVVLFLLVGPSPPVNAFNVCADISRCSECVFDQTDGLMPPPLMCGWCESTKTCKEVNSTVLSYYRSTLATGGVGGDGEAGAEHTAAEIAAFRTQFCEDFRERNFNAVCPDMFCSASQTTNNIYICRAPSIAALVFGCILFLLSILMYLWMRTIHQLPWKYEPFLSDFLAGRYRRPDSAVHGDDGDVAAVLGITPPSAKQKGHRAASPFCGRDSCANGFGKRDSAGGGEGASSSPAAPPPPPKLRSNARPPRAASSAASSAATSIVTAAATTGHCPLCKCRHPVPLGPGDVCFWCNVARFAFVPVSLALLSSSIVIVLTFAASLKPWFSDAYFAEVLIVAYLFCGGFVWYILRHRRCAPRFYLATEAAREAHSEVWSAAPCEQPNSQSPSAATSATSLTSGASATEEEEGGSTPSMQLLNDACRNMTRTTYLRLALRLRGRSLLDQLPELTMYRAQIEAMNAAPITLTRNGGVLTAMCAPRAAAAVVAGCSPRGGAAGLATTAAMDAAGVPMTTVLVISPVAEMTAASAVTAEGASIMAMTPTDEDTTPPPTAAAAAAPTASLPSSMSFPLQSARLMQHPTRPLLAATNATLESTDTVDSMGGYAFPSGVQETPAAAAAPVSAFATAAAGAAGAMPAAPLPTTATLPESVARQKRAETAQLLTSDSLSRQYRKALKATLFKDELIMWYSVPQLRGVLMENKWLLLGLLAGLLFGVWMLILSSVSDTTYAIVKLSGSTAVAACGLVVVLGFALLLIVVIRSCGRLYVLTNERLITVYESVTEPVVTATDLSSVRFAALYGYRTIWSGEPVLGFSWEVPASERKMPAIKSHKFAGITDLHEFIYYFRMVAPQMPYHLERISESTRQDRIEWRLYVILCIGVFVALPIITVYPHAVPDFLAAYLYVVALLFICSTLLRGLRTQQMTCAPLNLAASWASGSVWSEMDDVGPSRPLPSSVTHTPDAYSMQNTISSSMGNSEGPHDFSKLSASPPSLPIKQSD
ncbi:hypothetical protein LPMP_020320 [Leishmania panamensis]|uniref:Integral membrane protein n=1 Tax=Leishmania panamensis TaxID=5679 RepID=A0A088RGY1_LEIPA|nr:hypothetical protein LPMP_020320 [Leishmania panamensis]AIN95212.1 hypothetical protein LPMP_020320 [Leishmania panamensis]